MAWTAPMTAVAGSVFTAAQFNTHVRDNLNETAPAKATTTGSYFVGTGTNSIAERSPGASFETTTETLTATSYGAVATPGPSTTVTLTTRALVFIQCRVANNTVGQNTYASYAVSGATTSASVDERGIFFTSSAANQTVQAATVNLHTGLTGGSNTFTMEYRVTGGTGTVDNRRIMVFPY